jgi:Na+/phosphate symporter
MWREFAPASGGQLFLVRRHLHYAISDSKAVRHIAGYVVAAVLVALGSYGLVFEFVSRKTSEDILFGYVLAALFIGSGVLVYLATRFRYAAGIWFPVGLVLLFMGIVGSVLGLDILLKGTPREALLRILIMTTVFLIGAFVCLLLGHRRHQRASKCSPNDAV